MNRILVAVALSLVLLASACSSSAPTETGGQTDSTSSSSTSTTTTEATTADDRLACVGDDWVVVDAGPFTFHTPADLVDQNAQGIDSLVGQFRGGGLEVTFDFGWYSPGLDEIERLGATVMPVSLGEVAGEFASADATDSGFGSDHVTHLYARSVDDPANALWMGVNYDDVELTATAECIVSSVRFA